MQMAVIEYSRNVLGIIDANSSEIDQKCSNPVISLMESQLNVKNKGGTMRLGSWKCMLKKKSIAFSAYKKELINERHRHRFEYNNKYKETLESSGLVATGINPETKLVEIVENVNHPWFVGVQFHPEYKSTVLKPHPLFNSFVGATLKYKNNDY